MSIITGRPSIWSQESVPLRTARDTHAAKTKNRATATAIARQCYPILAVFGLFAGIFVVTMAVRFAIWIVLFAH
jgi:hypothetical protein